MYTISKRFTFSAAHQLRHLPEDHQCHRLHGHNYVVFIHLRAATLDEKGFVQDYGDLKPIKTWIDETLDHRFLNEVLHSEGPATTAENLARLIWNQFKMQFPLMYSVTIEETETVTATYTQEGYDG